MAATVFGAPRHGIVKDETATGLALASLSYDYTTEQAFAENHTGSTFAFSVFNEIVDVTAEGVVASRTTGLVTDLASVITLANESADSLSLNDQNLFSTANANAGTVVIGANLRRANKEFETGTLTMKFAPLVATNSPSTISD